ncbi:T9SS type A sorting domain-containing protein [Sporocytophaga myxococcoides]|uniref:T9SS type A sorting domain-containing protein n=1 Tax=Sporocytophaga myxococcoides TaxID=153721 RepID=UPI0003F84981|nr:T9SS type A sorting domain-containing protein [Sporocytophaga myxococcoides]
MHISIHWFYHLYPNPTEKHFILETGADLIEQASICDLQGVLQYSMNGKSYIGTRLIDVSSLNAGVYILKISDGQRGVR